MPSGARKRKAAKKKLQKEAHKNDKATNHDESHSLGNDYDNDNDKSHDERESVVGEGERESSEEPVVNNHAEVKEVSLDEQNVVNSDADVPVNTEEDCVRETKNGKHKRSSSSSSSSSSEDDEVVVEKEKPVVVDAKEVEQQVASSVSEASEENPVIAEVAYSSVEESIPVEESVKIVVSLPHESNVENDNESSENNPVISSVVESEMKEKLDEVVVVPSANVKDKVTPGVTDFVEKIETKVIQVVYEGSEKLSGVDMIPKDGEGLFPQSSGVTSTDASCGDNHVKESETHKYVEEKPLISSAPLPVHRTSWTNCCGLFEVFSS